MKTTVTYRKQISGGQIPRDCGGARYSHAPDFLPPGVRRISLSMGGEVMSALSIEPRTGQVSLRLPFAALCAHPGFRPLAAGPLTWPARSLAVALRGNHPLWGGAFNVATWTLPRATGDLSAGSLRCTTRQDERFPRRSLSATSKISAWKGFHHGHAKGTSRVPQPKGFGQFFGCVPPTSAAKDAQEAPLLSRLWRATRIASTVLLEVPPKAEANSEPGVQEKGARGCPQLTRFHPQQTRINTGPNFAHFTPRYYGSVFHLTVDKGHPGAFSQATERKDSRMEVWKDIAGFEGVCQVSNAGGVRRHPDWKGKKPGTLYHRRGKQRRRDYLVVVLHRMGSSKLRPMHRAVAEAFFGEVPTGCTVHHANGDSLDNAVANLVLMSREEHVALHRMLPEARA